jgi:hypothetical protein
LHLRIQKFASFLGLLAILMSTLAPTVSQTLVVRDASGTPVAMQTDAMPRGVDPGMADMSSMPGMSGMMDMSAVASTTLAASNGHTPGQTSDQKHTPPFHWQACGYCDLLAHFPGVPGVSAHFRITEAAARAPVAVPSPDPFVPPSLLAAQPRAPPGVSDSA